MSKEVDRPGAVIRFFTSEPIVLTVIALNGVAVFATQFPEVPDPPMSAIEWIDYGCTVYFVLEVLTKLLHFGVRGYFAQPWNRFDFIVVLLGTPLLFYPPSMERVAYGAFAFGPILELGRFLRFIRLMRFIPNANHIWHGLNRALRASVGVFAVLFGLNLILAMGANLLFGAILPQHFGDPITSCYTLFKVFTVEGWYEIPDQMADAGAPRFEVAALRLYMIFSVLTGGILGLSLANAVFVDEMTIDNNDELERRVESMHKELKELRTFLAERLPES